MAQWQTHRASNPAVLGPNPLTAGNNQPQKLNFPHDLGVLTQVSRGGVTLIMMGKNKTVLLRITLLGLRDMKLPY